MLIGSRSTMFTEEGYQGLKFTALSAGSTVSMTKVGSPPSISVQYSFNGRTWNSFDINSTSVTLSNVNDYVYFAAADNGNQRFSDGTNYTHFSFTGAVKASGNCMSLLDNTMQQDTLTASYSLGHVFYGTSSLVDASDMKLPCMNLCENAYANMFKNCYNLSSVENLDLPAVIVPNTAYAEMFCECKSLKKAMRVIQGTTFNSYSCSKMFYDCILLSTAPELCAVKFNGIAHFNEMFHYCKSLTAAPALPAKALGAYCYNYMFAGCTSLISTPDFSHISSVTGADGCFRYTFSGCSQLKYASDLPNLAPPYNYCSFMF